MIYAENIFFFLIAPFIVSLFLLKGETRRFISFFIIGATCCLLASYINSFTASLMGIDTQKAIVEIAPIIEEVVKALPLLFFMIIFSPKKDVIFQCAVATGIGFATFENCCCVVTNGADDIYFILIRGFSVGIMHVLCAAVLGYAMGFGENQTHFSWLGIFGSVSICIAYHSVYNLMVSGGDVWRVYGYFLSFITVLIIILVKSLLHFVPKAK